MCPKVISSEKVVKMRQIGTFLCWKICTGGFRVGFQSPYPKLYLGNFLFLAGRRSASWQAIFGPDCPKLPFLEPEIVLLCYAGTPKRHFVLTTFWDEITFGHITQWLGADFDKTHFFQRRPVLYFILKHFKIANPTDQQHFGLKSSTIWIWLENGWNINFHFHLSCIIQVSHVHVQYYMFINDHARQKALFVYNDVANFLQNTWDEERILDK